ncbi:uncharacterized protein EI90DRAFT_3086289 [Cantharellus anzutake]|uniref:uncharacterized protein n=1 Tax=Cantharellus anzutake TaxID=1750568 RepID=UPI0019050384|nr:uncharacterized protein EI90DRAFT_3086289 [Cantharellus anzutake]KAF8316467.1 hypothetical protein EI90DRAFT_3086289 [Cantharellus anzutake]
MSSSQSRAAHSSWPHITMDSIVCQTLLFSLLFLAYGADKVLAQDTNATCLPSFNWALNSAKENPCKVASELQAVCDGGSIVVSLPPGYHYIGPVKGSETNAPNYCACTSIVYELMSACGACQNRTFISYPAWTIDCTNISTTEGEYNPSLIPSGTLVPRWAYLKPSSYGGLFNIEIAMQIGDAPESSRSLSLNTTSSTTTTTPTLTLSGGTDLTTTTFPTSTVNTSTTQHFSTPTPTPTPRGGSRGRSSNTGAFMRGVVGGLVGLALVTVM